MGFFANFFGLVGGRERGARGERGPEAGAGVGVGIGVGAGVGTGRPDDSVFEANVRSALEEMRRDLDAAVRSSAEAMSVFNRLDAEHRGLARRADELHQGAREALARGDEPAARALLAERAGLETRLRADRAGLEAARRAGEEARQRANALRVRIEEAERNAATLIARRNAARAQRRVAAVLAATENGDGAFAALRAFEQRVAAGQGDESGEGGGARGVDGSAVEAELARLREEIRRGA